MAGKEGAREPRQERVLLIEARPRLRDRLARACAEAGLTVVPAADVAEALAEARGARLDALVVSAAVAEESARLRELAEEAPGPGLLVLFEKDARSPAARAEALGAAGWLVRPASPSAVAAAAAGLARATRLEHRLALRDRQLAEALSENGQVDPFTGFYRFEGFKPLLATEVKRARRYRYPFSLLLIAFDDLETVRAGHGDGVARTLAGALARALSAGLRDLDLPVAFEQGQLLVVMPHTPRRGARTVAERLRRHAQRARLGQEDAFVGSRVSIGLAAYEGEGEVSFAALAREAAEALSIAVQAGGNRVAEVPVTRRGARRAPSSRSA